MGPDELLWDGSLWDVAHVFEERSLLELDVHAVSKAVVCLARKGILIDSEGVPNLTTAALVALEGHKADLLSESQRAERLFDLLLLLHKLFWSDLHRCLSNRFHVSLF